MQNFLNSLSTDNVISIIGIIASLLTSIVAIVISLKTLKQNSVMINESTRPYVVMYSQTTNFQNSSLYLVLKNFGQSGATITKLECDFDLSLWSVINNKTPFSNFEGVFIAPGQSFLTSLHTRKVFENPHPITFKITYRSGNRSYSDSFTINPSSRADLVKTRAATDGKELKIISYTLQDLVEKNL